MKLSRVLSLAMVVCCWFSLPGHAGETAAAMSFGVISQRSAVQTAQYWNPILRYVSQHSGVPLQIKLAKSGPDHAQMIGRGDFDFLYSNHNFTPKNAQIGYAVFARPIDTAIRGQIIVLAHSPIQSITELHQQEVVFPSAVAFVGYHVPMDALLRAGIQVKPQFAGNQEGALGQLVSGRTQAAAVNSEVARDFFTRQKITYRVLWSSEEYLNIPISAHPSVPPAVVYAVRDALLKMADDPEGIKVLAASAALMQKDRPYGFVAASDREYDNARRFYKNSLLSTANQ